MGCFFFQIRTLEPELEPESPTWKSRERRKREQKEGEDQRKQKDEKDPGKQKEKARSISRNAAVKGVRDRSDFVKRRFVISRVCGWLCMKLN